MMCSPGSCRAKSVTTYKRREFLELLRGIKALVAVQLVQEEDVRHSHQGLGFPRPSISVNTLQQTIKIRFCGHLIK